MMTVRGKLHLVELVDAAGDADRHRPPCRRPRRPGPAAPRLLGAALRRAGPDPAAAAGAGQDPLPAALGQRLLRPPRPGRGDRRSRPPARLAEELGVAGVAADGGRRVHLPGGRPGHRSGRARVRPRAGRRGSPATWPCAPDPAEVADVRWVRRPTSSRLARRATTTRRGCRGARRCADLSIPSTLMHVNQVHGMYEPPIRRHGSSARGRLPVGVAPSTLHPPGSPVLVPPTCAADRRTIRLRCSLAVCTAARSVQRRLHRPALRRRTTAGDRPRPPRRRQRRPQPDRRHHRQAVDRRRRPQVTAGQAGQSTKRTRPGRLDS